MDKLIAAVLKTLKKHWVPASAATLLSLYAYRKGWLKHFLFAAACAFVVKFGKRYLLKQGGEPRKKPSTTRPTNTTSATVQTFEDACAFVKTCDGLSNEKLLELYGLFKQATKGDCTTPKPSTFVLI